MWQAVRTRRSATGNQTATSNKFTKGGGVPEKNKKQKQQTKREHEQRMQKLYGYRGTINDLAAIRWMAASYTKGLTRESGACEHVGAEIK